MYRVMCLCILIAFVGLVPAMADTWDFTFASATALPFAITGSGTFDTNPTGLPGTIVGLTGTFSCFGPNCAVPPGGTGYTDSMTLLAPGTFGGNDNVFVGPTQYFTVSGFSWESGGYDWNIFYASVPSGTGGYIFTGCPVGQVCGSNNTYGVPSTPLNFQAHQVPDGGVTLMLLGGALVGLETLRRKFRA